ncbi:hypothetical protein [Actinophytocola sediminis]
MPTLHITSGPLPAARRRAVAVRLTRWLRDRGVPPGNVVVNFADHPPNTVFSGAMPVEALGAATARLRHASVVCQLGPDRDERFRDELCAEIADALGADADTGFLTIEFRPTRPDHVHVWRAGAPHRADRSSLTAPKGN